LIVPKQNRAQSATELLQELNSDVSGNFVEEVCFPKLVILFLLNNVIRVWNNSCVGFLYCCSLSSFMIKQHLRKKILSYLQKVSLLF